MAQKKKRNGGSGAARLSDEEVIRRLEEDAPAALSKQILTEVFEAITEKPLMESPSVRDKSHFYCRECHEYHLKTHPHYKLEVPSGIHHKAK